MQPDFWDDKRPAGVASQLDFKQYRSVIEVFERSCKKFADIRRSATSASR